MKENHTAVNKVTLLSRREVLAGGTALMATIALPLSACANDISFTPTSAARKTNHQRRHEMSVITTKDGTTNLLQGLGQRPSRDVLTRLATELRCLGWSDAVSRPTRLSLCCC